MGAAVTAEYTLTFDEFAEAYRAQRGRKRFLSGPREPSVWVGVWWMLGLTVVVALALVVSIYATGHTVTSPSGKTSIESNSRISVFFLGLLPFPLIAGIFWLIGARSSVERRILRGAQVLFLTVGATVALPGALPAPPPPPPVPPTTAPLAEQPSELISYLPAVVGIGGCIVLLIQALRRTV